MTTPPVLDLNLIQLFVTIVEAGTLSEAALRQGVTRSHVSRNLQKLERAFGAQLIRRTTRRLELTHEGSVLYDHGARMAREVESARHALQKLGAEPTGHVRLSLPTGLGELDMLRPLLVRFALEHPSLSLRVLFSNRVSDLISSEIDVALRAISVPPQDYVARELGRIKWHLCAAPEYLARMGMPAHPRDLGRFDFLGPPGARPRQRCACAARANRMKSSWPLACNPSISRSWPKPPAKARAWRCCRPTSCVPTWRPGACCRCCPPTRPKARATSSIS